MKFYLFILTVFQHTFPASLQVILSSLVITYFFPNLFLKSAWAVNLGNNLIRSNQSIDLAQLNPPPPALEPQPTPQPLPPLPSPNELLQPVPAPSPQPNLVPGEVPATIQVERFNVVCGTANQREGECHFDPDILAEVAKRAVTGELSDLDSNNSDSNNSDSNNSDSNDPQNCPNFDGSDLEVDRPLSFAQLLQARSAITAYYTCRGYITSGAFIPPQVLQSGVITIQVIEGSLDSITVTGTRRLNPSYVRSRLRIASTPPVNVNRLLEALQLLQLNPLIGRISAELQAGTRPGTSLLQVDVAEANSISIPLALDNDRVPSVGSFQQQIQVNQANLTGLGDRLSLGYAHTEGSNQFDGSYTLPLNPHNGTLNFAYGTSDNNVIEPPFDVLEIQSDSQYYELTYRQPLIQTPTEELALGFVGSHQYSATALGIDDIGPFPLSPGADEEGKTRVSAARFFQEWIQRSSQQVFAVRSQFSLGLDVLDANISDDAPDSRFFSWRGQGQWVRLLDRDTLLLLRAEAQLASEPLLSLEQIGIGGQNTVRGYRQDALLTDNGVLVSAEVRVPVVRIPGIDGLLQVAPFVDAGTGWNINSEDPDPNVLVGAGLGLIWQMGDDLSARIDWGIPLIEVESENRTWQENGIYFSITYTPSF